MVSGAALTILVYSYEQQIIQAHDEDNEDNGPQDNIDNQLSN